MMDALEKLCRMAETGRGYNHLAELIADADDDVTTFIVTWEELASAAANFEEAETREEKEDGREAIAMCLEEFAAACRDLFGGAR